MHVHPERRMAIMNEVHDITYVLIWRNNIMMRSMYSAVSGLKAHQTRMDVIGNNIANVNTVAFKSQSMTFSEVFIRQHRQHLDLMLNQVRVVLMQNRSDLVHLLVLSLLQFQQRVHLKEQIVHLI